MDRAAQALVGTHDFAAFQSTGTPVKTSVRTVSLARVLAGDASTKLDERGRALQEDTSAFGGSPIVVRMEANGFLRHMVRAVVGTLVEIGDGRRPADSIHALIDSRDRAAAGATAPPTGLVLVHVSYGPLVAPVSGSL